MTADLPELPFLTEMFLATLLNEILDAQSLESEDVRAAEVRLRNHLRDEFAKGKADTERLDRIDEGEYAPSIRIEENAEGKWGYRDAEDEWFPTLRGLLDKQLAAEQEQFERELRG